MARTPPVVQLCRASAGEGSDGDASTIGPGKEATISPLPRPRQGLERGRFLRPQYDQSRVTEAAHATLNHGLNR